MILKIKQCFFVAAVCLTLASCGPKYQDKYTFIPPGKDGADCANKCVIQKDQCDKNCMDKGAIVDLGNRAISSLNGFDYGTDSESTDACYQNCIQSHVVCHQNCGGKVKTERVCVSNCK